MGAATRRGGGLPQAWLGAAALALGLGCGGTRKLLRDAEGYYAEGRYSAAVRTYERVLEAKPGEPEALVGVARAWLETDQPERAIVPAQVAAETKVPGGKEALVDALVANGRGADARATAEALVAAAPTDPTAHQRQLEALLAAGQLQPAMSAAEKIIELGGGARAMASAAWAQVRVDNCGRATTLASRASAAAVADAGVQAEAAAVFRLCGDAERASATANAARGLLTDNGALWSVQAKRRLDGGDAEGAVRRLSWLRAVYGDDGQIAARLGSAWLKAGDAPRASGELGAALKLAPYIATNQLASGVHVAYRAADQLSEQDRQVAVTAILRERARADAARGDGDAAAEAQEEALRRSGSRDPAEWLQVAMAWQTAPDPTRGLDAARMAADLAPDSFEARLVLASVLARRRELEQAIGHAQLAFRMRPSDERGALLLGNLLISRGDLREAERVYTDALAANPKSAAVRDALRRLPKR